MTGKDERPAIGGRDGGTTGTGDREATAGARRQGPASEADSDTMSLASGDEAVDTATGEGSDDRVSGTGTAAQRSGRATSEGNVSDSSATDPGDPGGMGGTRTNQSQARGRPPGGSSPIDGD